MGRELNNNMYFNYNQLIKFLYLKNMIVFSRIKLSTALDNFNMLHIKKKIVKCSPCNFAISINSSNVFNNKPLYSINMLSKIIDFYGNFDGTVTVVFNTLDIVVIFKSYGNCCYYTFKNYSMAFLNVYNNLIGEILNQSDLIKLFDIIISLVYINYDYKKHIVRFKNSLSPIFYLEILLIRKIDQFIKNYKKIFYINFNTNNNIYIKKLNYIHNFNNQSSSTIRSKLMDSNRSSCFRKSLHLNRLKINTALMENKSLLDRGIYVTDSKPITNQFTNFNTTSYCNVQGDKDNNTEDYVNILRKIGSNIDFKKLTNLYDSLDFNQYYQNVLRYRVAWAITGTQLSRIQIQVIKGSGKIFAIDNELYALRYFITAALNYVKTVSAKYNICTKFCICNDIYIRVLGKYDLPSDCSLGVTLISTLVSAILDMPLKIDIVTIAKLDCYGNLIAVDNLYDKVKIAYKSGIRRVIVSEHNKPEICTFPSSIKSSITFILVNSLQDVLSTTLHAARDNR